VGPLKQAVTFLRFWGYSSTMGDAIPSSAEVQVEMVLVEEGRPHKWGGEVEAALFPFVMFCRISPIFKNNEGQDKY
jgi:hypothetical protein